MPEVPSDRAGRRENLRDMRVLVATITRVGSRCSGKAFDQDMRLVRLNRAGLGEDLRVLQLVLPARNQIAVIAGLRNHGCSSDAPPLSIG